MLVKLFLLAAAAWFAFKLWKGWQQTQQQVQQRREREAFEPTVQCRRCGVHLPVTAVSPTGLCGKCSG